MKIGIITVHRAYNYGSVLQCYALQEYLRSQGHDVWIVDYRQQWTEETYSTFSLSKIDKLYTKPKSLVKYVLNTPHRYFLNRSRRAVFKKFCNHFRLTEACGVDKIVSGFDAYIIGSDQLWSFACVGGEDPVYTGNFIHDKSSRIIGYALSSNFQSIRALGTNGLNRIISNFDKISFREESIISLIKDYTGKTLQQVLDPTLLMDENIWLSFIKHSGWEEKKYIAVYQAREVCGDKNFLIKKANVLSGQIGCKVINMSSMTYSVENFLSIIKYAQFVITTSFHATVFSIIFETPCFAVRLGDGYDCRYVDLLYSLGNEGKKEVVEKDFVPKPFYLDFKEMKKNLNVLRRNSYEFLKNI